MIDRGITKGSLIGSNAHSMEMGYMTGIINLVVFSTLAAVIKRHD